MEGSMSNMSRVFHDDGKVWAVASGGIPHWLEVGSLAQVVIPVEQMDGLTDEEIGRRVRECVPIAWELKAEEDAYNEAVREKDAKPTIKQPVDKSGYIYLIHGVGTKWYKIGQSINPEVRREELGTQGPFKYAQVWAFTVNDMDAVEDFLHRHFAHRRVEGEWFVLSEWDIEAFKRVSVYQNHTVFDVAEILCAETEEP
jgi:predicted flap endonuclease-1-like 5' DNA nuclease